MKKISIVIPAYNEEKRIVKTLKKYGKYFNEKLKKRKISDYSFLVVVNNCSDNTLDVVKKEKKKNNKIKYLNFKQGGKGFAIVEGFKESLKKDYSLIGFVDADMSTPPEAFFYLIEKINDFDGVIASRWIKGSIVRSKQTIIRRIMSRGFNFIVRVLFLMPYRDTQCGAKLFKKKAIKDTVNEFGITKWAFDIDLIYKLRKKGFKIKEVPTIWEDKEGSKINITKTPFQMFSAVIRLRLIYSPLKFIVRFYDKLIPEKVKFHHRN